ncbi:restriction endonuclease subunit S [Flavobacterium sp.]|uniref:restriction endonuclease subunit S n=1 Tax=Flavobacterium sp. TaxID=239 RepID=UPI003750470C
MRKYSKYKPSNIEWIGDIPEHWEIKVLKRLAKICNGQDHKKVWDANGQFPIIGTGGTFGYTDSYLHEGPSVILGRKGTIDKPQYMEAPFWSVDTAYYTDIFPSTNPRYFYHLCNTINFELYKYGSAVPSMSQEVLNQIPFAVPNDIKEQTAIANYIDKKTKEIDQLIGKKKQLIQLFEEEKRIVISLAVSKGINQNKEVKESGIDWMGEIPKHWDIKKISWCFSNIGSGTTPKSGEDEYYFNGYINWLLTGDLNDGEIFETSKKITDKAIEDYTSLKVYPVDSIVIAMYGATIGKLGLLKIETTVNQACCVMSNPLHHTTMFLFYYLFSVKQEIINMSYGGGQPNISQEILKTLRITVPPIEEQEKIVNHIELESSRIDSKIKKTKKLIDLLIEYRSALISEVVTGKVKVID